MPGQPEQLAEPERLPESGRPPESGRLPESGRPESGRLAEPRRAPESGRLAEPRRAPESGRLAEPRRAPEAPRPHEAREARDIGTELQARLERLPLSHPSCPYNPDGSRKPPEPDPRERERPLPREAARTDLPEEDGPRIDPDGSWHWKGRDLSPEQNRIADEALARFRTAEGRDADGHYGDHGLTPAMRRVESQLEHGRLVPDTEKFALKSPDRFKEKLARMILRNPDKTPTELAKEVHDAVRYTFLFRSETYRQGIWETHSLLEGEGCELEVRRNTWYRDDYKGVNSRWRDIAGDQLFEVQFHTDDSWDAKQKTHLAYEKIEDVRTPSPEAQELRAFQREVTRRVEAPPRIEDVTDYHRDQT